MKEMLALVLLVISLVALFGELGVKCVTSHPDDKAELVCSLVHGDELKPKEDK